MPCQRLKDHYVHNWGASLEIFRILKCPSSLYIYNVQTILYLHRMFRHIMLLYIHVCLYLPKALVCWIAK